MKQNIITKAVLAKELKQSGLAFGDALECIDTLFESMAEALVEGKRVELRGFGSFKIVRLASRKTALNGGVTIPEHDRIHFRAGIKLRKAVSGNVKRKK